MISFRLRFIADIIPVCDVLADIGTDHGYVPFELLKSGRVNRVIATDISSESLQKAVELTQRENLVDKVSLRVGDGLEPLRKDEADILVIAGMGGRLIANILEEGYNRKFDSKNPMIVLQPVQQAGELRIYLYTHDFEINDEYIFEDSGKVYQLIVCQKHTYIQDKDRYLLDTGNTAQVKFGTINIKKKTDLLKKIVDYEISKTAKIIDAMIEQNIDRWKIEDKLNYLRDLEKVKYEFGISQ